MPHARLPPPPNPTGLPPQIGVPTSPPMPADNAAAGGARDGVAGGDFPERHDDPAQAEELERQQDA